LTTSTAPTVLGVLGFLLLDAGIAHGYESSATCDRMVAVRVAAWVQATACGV